MENQFFEQPILNSPYEYPTRHRELDDSGQPTQKILPQRRLGARRCAILRPFDKPTAGRIAVKVINRLGDEVMKVFRV